MSAALAAKALGAHEAGKSARGAFVTEQEEEEDGAAGESGGPAKPVEAGAAVVDGHDYNAPENQPATSSLSC